MLSVEPWLVELTPARGWKYGAASVSVLSVEPWLVEPRNAEYLTFKIGVSVLSVEPWLVERDASPNRLDAMVCFSALSRAVVGGTKERLHIQFYSRLFQCSQSSRGWWNIQFVGDQGHGIDGFSALSRAVVGGTGAGHAVGVSPECFSALSRAVVGGTEASASNPASVTSFSALSRAVVGGTDRAEIV